MDKQQCAERIFHPSGNWHYYTDCTRKAVVEADGQWWCSIHSPEGVANRRARQDAKVKAQMAAFTRKFDLQAARARVIEAAKAWQANTGPEYAALWSDDLADAVLALVKLEDE